MVSPFEDNGMEERYVTNREEDIRAHCKQKKYSKEYTEYWTKHPVCEACRKRPARTPHHIRSRGSSGVIDEPWNLLALCQKCNYGLGGVHGIDGGNKALAKRYPCVARKIISAKRREVFLPK